MAKDIFYIPPKGVPELRGPHVLGTIEYDCDFWMNYKLLLIKANREFIKSHSSEYMENLADLYGCDAYILYEENPDVVVNFAAESHVDRSIENPEIFLDTKSGIERFRKNRIAI